VSKPTGPKTVSARILVTRLGDAGYAPTKLESMLENRVSYRALYRWRNGEARPQRRADYDAVLQLALALGVSVYPSEGDLPEPLSDEDEDTTDTT
jgi:hypothetical protein